jgi:hypothetical protein
MRLEAQLHFPVLLSQKRRVSELHMSRLWVLIKVLMAVAEPLESVDETENYTLPTLYYYMNKLQPCNFRDLSRPLTKQAEVSCHLWL